MDTRRGFLRQSLLLAAAGGRLDELTAAIARAASIEPAPGSTFLDAEHVVILMQENRSFDHCYGALQGVRGFNDPRAVTLPNGLPVWFQTNAAGETHAPFRLELLTSKATWMGCLPHDWPDQQQARADGRHDGWLDAKKSGHSAYAGLPLTLGHYTREDLPFYHALADAFTVCDQNFCSSLTGTTPNRLHLWTGTVRPEKNRAAKAHIRNSDADIGSEVSWKTFPELLEDLGLSWRTYQNELWTATGLSAEEDRWLGNFGDNPLEYFTQFGAPYHPPHQAHLARRHATLLAQLEKLDAEPRPWTMEQTREGVKLSLELARLRGQRQTFSAEAFARLSPRERSLHERAFTTNAADPRHRALETLAYRDGDTPRELSVPAGDVLHRFRADVQAGTLPAVSWLVAPQNFSDHPDSPWYGAWYLAEALDILTRNPEVWRKTVFILCYDENDGYFDHIPPFVPPHPDRPATGLASPGLETELEFVEPAQEAAHRARFPRARTHAGPIGLGFRVPLVVASPWSRGGWVNSQIFDHTSIIQFLEVLFSHKTGKPLRTEAITAWRRAVCGDLTSVFRPVAQETAPLPVPPEREKFLTGVHQAQFRPAPGAIVPLSPEEIALAKANPRAHPRLPRQEPGTRPSCALPYALDANAWRDAAKGVLFLTFSSHHVGAPFRVQSLGRTRVDGGGPDEWETGRVWNCTVAEGALLSFSLPLDLFEEGRHHLHIHGPNGFFREFRGGVDDPPLRFTVACRKIRSDSSTDLPAPREQSIAVVRLGPLDQDLYWLVHNLRHPQPPVRHRIGASDNDPGLPGLVLDLAPAHGWYDFRLTVDGFPHFSQRFAGRVENGRPAITDPAMA